MLGRLAALAPLAVGLAGLAAAGPRRIEGALEPRTSNREPRVLRICADPNNLPFSNDRREGFENKLAELVARQLGARVQYTWWAQRRGFVRNTLNAGTCDVLMGVPMSFELALPTRPYYRSTYVFVVRRDSKLRVSSFDDPVLRTVRVGVQLVGDDGANTPPAHALARRGVIENVRGYTVYGDYRRPNPPARIVEAVAAGEIDVAVVWGPLAGFFAPRQTVPLEMIPVSPQIDLPFLPFVFDISIGVRRGNDTLRAELERALRRRRAAVDSILADYHVPRVDRPVGQRGSDGG
ncbi:MAG: substrate-binding domain-containing protein [Gemmatimonadota bacterium]|nr:substrate-binding domain-containing protein [Gemmatimonadota bacterium]